MVSPISELIGLGGALAVIGGLQPAAHARQRRAQIVRDVVADLLDLAHQRLDAVEHQIEVFGDAIPFVVRSAERNTLVEAALHDGAAGRVDLLDAPDGAARHQHAGHGSEHEDQR